MSQKRCGPGARLPKESTRAGNVIPLRTRNVTLQTTNCNVRHLVDLLDRADAEQRTLLDFRRHRQAFEVNPNLDNEIALFEARDQWAAAFKARCS